MPLANPKSTQLLSDHSLAAKLGSTYGFRCSAKLLINNADLPPKIHGDCLLTESYRLSRFLTGGTGFSYQEEHSEKFDIR